MGVEMRRKFYIFLEICIVILAINLIKKMFFNNTYDVIFNTNGGSSISNQVIASGKKVRKPNDPSKKGFIFKEWQLNGITFDFDTKINDNITLNAVWEYDINDYEIKTKDGLKKLLIDKINNQQFDNKVQDFIIDIFDILYLNYPIWQQGYKDLPDVNTFILENLIMVIPNIKTINLYLDGTDEAKEVEKIGAGYTTKDENDELYISLVYDDFKKKDDNKHLLNLEALFHEIIHCKQLMHEETYASNDSVRTMLLEGGATFNARFVSKYDSNTNIISITCNKDISTCFEHSKETGNGATYLRYMYAYDMLNYIVGYDNINKLEKGIIDVNYLSNLLIQKVDNNLLSLMANWCTVDMNDDNDFISLIKIEEIFLNEIKKDIENLNSFDNVRKYIDIYRHIKIKTLPKMGKEEVNTHAKEDFFDEKFNIKELDELFEEKIINYNVLNKFSNDSQLNKMAIKSIIKANHYNYYTYDGVYESLPLSYHLDKTMYYYFEKNKEGHLILKYNNPFYSKDRWDLFEIIYLEYIFNENKILSIKGFNPAQVNTIKKYYDVYKK